MAMFDYISFANSMRIDSAVVASFEGEAKQEFPNDDMLRELHIMRALKTYFNSNGKIQKIKIISSVSPFLFRHLA